MPRIPEADIERIKRETDLVALVRSRGVELRAHGGKDFAGRCPFHEEKTSSFIVSPQKGLFHCMGCGRAGNAIQFVEQFDGVSFRHAFEILSAGKPAFSATSAAPVKKTTVPRLESPLETTADDATLMRQVVDYYHERLWRAPVALDYLRGRGLCHEETLRRFKIGLSDRTLGLRLPTMQRKEGEAIRTRLQTLGVYRENGREHFNGRIILPVFTSEGGIGELYGRLHTKLKPDIPKHLYLPGPHRGIWNLEALNSGEVILCEAPFDALTFYVNGFKNVTFIYGTEGFTAELFDALLARKIRRVHLAYDADEAGNRATERDAKKLLAHGIECFRVKFPWGMDANEYACKVKPPDKSLALLIHSAEWLGGSAEPKPIPPPLSSPPVLPPVVPPSSDSSHAPAPAPSSSLAACLAAKEKTPPLEKVGEHHLLRLGEREYRVGGLDKNNSLEVLKITLRLMQMGQGSALFHLDSFDMARDGERRRFIERAAEETRLEKELIKRDIARLLLALEQEQTARMSAALLPAAESRSPELSTEEREEALAFLKAPRLIERIREAFPLCGLAGEVRSGLAAYLSCTSRLLDKPLAVIIQSTSAAGKSTLMEAVLAMFPEEECIKYSAMTGQSLYYLGETNLKHKILAIIEEEGAEKASYALKLLQSEGELTIASTGKDPTTGKMVTQEYHVQGPVMIFLTTTAVDIDEELLNRCLILTVDESREQTERIHALQRQSRTLEGLRLKQRKQTVLTLMRNAQRLLRPLNVMNPYADRLTFTVERTRTRRDHEKYLTLIDAIALLHQHQRPIEHDPESGEFIRVTLDDIALANKLAPELLGRSLDELPPQTRQLLETIKQVIKKLCQEQKLDQAVAFFSRRDLQAVCGWSYSQIKRHLIRLQELEYIAPRFGRLGATLQYELLIDANEPSAVAHIGLLDVAKLKSTIPTTTTRTGLGGGWTPLCQNDLARLSPVSPVTCANLATLPDRTSGAALAAIAS